MRRHWESDAACAGMDPEDFFPERGDAAGVVRAKAICAGCPVIDDCRETHIKEKDGIWFGTSARERRLGLPGLPVRPVGYVSAAEHGTRSRYKAGCSCQPCRDAEAAYQASRYRRQVPVQIRPPMRAAHGTRSRYVAGCLCPACREAERVYQAARWRERQKPAIEHARALASPVQAG